MAADCKKFNEGTFRKIENFLETPKAVQHDDGDNYFKSMYSSATLINDWFEKRTSEQISETPTEALISEHMDKFRKLCESNFPDRGAYFNKMFDSYGYGQELLIDHLGYSYYGNFVSSYDLCYNHLKKGICGPYPRHYYRGKYKPSTDLSLIYGNLTQWGLKEELYKKMKACEEDITTSENRYAYIHHDMSMVNKLNDFPKFKRKKVVY